MIDYSKIAEANKGIKFTNVKGKNYAEVAQRVQAFRKVIPDGYITTDILSNADGVVYMRAEVGYYENGNRVMLATGLAFERQDASNVNKTSFIENCETSAIGRALGFVGFGSESSIASVEELTRAIETQNAIACGEIPDTKPAEVKTVAKVPPVVSPVLEFLARERESLRVVREIGKAENNAIWKAQVAALTDAGIIPAKPLSDFTMQEASEMVNAMYKRFSPKGTVLTDDGQTN